MAAEGKRHSLQRADRERAQDERLRDARLLSGGRRARESLRRLLRFNADGRDVSFAAKLSARRGLGNEKSRARRNPHARRKNFYGKPLYYSKRRLRRNS